MRGVGGVRKCAAQSSTRDMGLRSLVHLYPVSGSGDVPAGDGEISPHGPAPRWNADPVARNSARSRIRHAGRPAALRCRHGRRRPPMDARNERARREIAAEARSPRCPQTRSNGWRCARSAGLRPCAAPSGFAGSSRPQRWGSFSSWLAPWLGTDGGCCAACSPGRTCPWFRVGSAPSPHVHAAGDVSLGL
jgi:hypothetical protein